MTTLLAPELDRALRALPQACRLCGTRYPAAPEGTHSTSMLLAAFATGILVGVIIALMFF